MVFAVAGAASLSLTTLPDDAARGDLARFAVQIELAGQGVIPDHRLVELQRDFVLLVGREVGLLQVGAVIGWSKTLP